MDNGSSLSASDVAMLTGNNGMWGDGGAFMWIFALLILANGGFGGFGNNVANAIGYENLATSNEVQRGFDNQNLQAQTRDILNAVTTGTAQTIQNSTQNATNAINAIKDGNASLIREFGNVETALTALSGKQQECCCDVKQLVQATSANTDAQIASAKYDTSMQMAQMEARLAAKMDANKIEELQNQVNQLQLAQATNGMLKFPNSWSYGAGQFPPIFGGCNCGNV